VGKRPGNEATYLSLILDELQTLAALNGCHKLAMILQEAVCIYQDCGTDPRDVHSVHSCTALVRQSIHQSLAKCFSRSLYLDSQLQKAAQLAHLMLIVRSTSASFKAASPHPKDFQRNSIVTKTVIASSIFIFICLTPFPFYLPHYSGALYHLVHPVYWYQCCFGGLATNL